MIPLLEQHRSEIEALCRKYQVRKLELFGSAARGDFDSESDFDFFVEYQNLGWEGSFKRYMHLKLGLEDLLGRSVDLIEATEVENQNFLNVANQYREQVYVA